MTDNWTYQVSPKVGDTLVNIRATTAFELEEACQEFPVAAVTQLLANIAGANALAPSVQPAQGATPTHNQPPAQPAGGNVRTCPHGVRVYKTGNGARGKWEGYFCALPKNDPNNCGVEWVR